MGGLGDADLASGQTTNLGNLASRLADNATNHVGGDTDVLSAEVGRVTGGRRRSSAIGGGDDTSAATTVCWMIRAISRTTIATFVGSERCATVGIGHALLVLRSRVVQDGSETTFPVFQETTTDVFDGLSNTFRSTLDFDDTFGGLREHLLGSNHAGPGGILDGLDLGSVATDNRAHEVVRDQETERGMGRDRCDGHSWRIGTSRSEELSDDDAVGLIMG